MASKAQVAKAVDSRLVAAAARVRRKSGDLAVSASYDARRRRVVVELRSGSAVAIPVERVQGLSSANASQIKAVEVTGKGYGLHWPLLDVDIAVPDLIAGCFGTRAWMSALGKYAGSATSEAKAAAARENGKKGGRPRTALQHADSPFAAVRGRPKAGERTDELMRVLRGYDEDATDPGFKRP